MCECWNAGVNNSDERSSIFDKMQDDLSSFAKNYHVVRGINLPKKRIQRAKTAVESIKRIVEKLPDLNIKDFSRFFEWKEPGGFDSSLDDDDDSPAEDDDE